MVLESISKNNNNIKLDVVSEKVNKIASKVQVIMKLTVIFSIKKW